jgi:hypothetical protein
MSVESNEKVRLSPFIMGFILLWVIMYPVVVELFNLLRGHDLWIHHIAYPHRHAALWEYIAINVILSFCMAGFVGGFGLTVG